MQASPATDPNASMRQAIKPVLFEQSAIISGTNGIKGLIPNRWRNGWVHSLCHFISRAEATTLPGLEKQKQQQNFLCLKQQQQKQQKQQQQLQHLSSALRQAEAVLLILLLVEAGLTG